MKLFYFIIATMICITTGANGQLTTDWYLSFGSKEADQCSDIKMDDSDNLYSFIEIYDSTDIDPGPGTIIIEPEQEHAVVLVKVNKEGELAWHQVFYTGENGYGNVYEINHNRLLISIVFRDSLVNINGAQRKLLHKNTGANNCIISMDLHGKINNAYYTTAPDYFYLHDIITMPDKSLIVSGAFKDTFQPSGTSATLVSRGNRDGFVMAMDPAFKLQWIKHFGSRGVDGVSMLCVANEKIHFSYMMRDTLYLPVGSSYDKIPCKGGEDFVFGYMNLQGDMMDYVAVGNEGYDDAKSLVVDKDGNIYLSGNFENTVNFAGKSSVPVYHTSINKEDGFIAKYNPQFQLEWVRIYPNTLYGGIGSLHIERGNELYAAGGFTQHADLDPGPDSIIVQAGNYLNAFLTKLDTDGNFYWSYCFNSTITSSIREIAVSTETNRLYAFGYYSGSMNCTPMLSENLLTSIGGYDIFMIALDEANVISASPLIPTIEFDIYPNPAADHITIATENEITCVSLFDMNGRKLRHWGQEGLHEKEISLADLLPGMYFIQVAAEDVQLAKKIIVE